MKINRLLVAILIALISASFSSAEYAELTPEWAEENPGRLTLGMGSAMGGWNDYIFRLHFDSPRVFTVRSQVLLKRKNKTGHVPLHTFDWSVDKPDTVLPVKIRTPSFTPPEESDKDVVKRADVSIVILAREVGPDGEPMGLPDRFDLKLSDFNGVNILPEPKDGSPADTSDGGQP
ncbi:hypothetical protein FYK55_26205 [Roseiconus nitratireducens]|uniref:Uncharacterized protein n=1 Tax=Roseiconus nitratireducens TaxID=2605748 RepID=A0A5M6CY58_9BACT|nr:hypothetical protein [Roseiconus nitratireducens]KAA5538932.1 hypothetical protein FYK55_26205 [Roseiconus nitratireducens]